MPNRPIKWTLQNWVGYTFTFEEESSPNTLTVFARTLNEAVAVAESLLREGAEIDVSGWEE